VHLDWCGTGAPWENSARLVPQGIILEVGSGEKNGWGRKSGGIEKGRGGAFVFGGLGSNGPRLQRVPTVDRVLFAGGLSPFLEAGDKTMEVGVRVGGGAPRGPAGVFLPLRAPGLCSWVKNPAPTAKTVVCMFFRPEPLFFRGAERGS